MYIGIIGSKASGKEEVAQYLVGQHQFTRLYLRPGAPALTTTSTDESQTEFQSAKDMLSFTTPRWRTRFVTTDVTDPVDLYLLLKRPFFMVVGIDAPLGLRYRRYTERSMRQADPVMSLDEFVALDDSLMYAAPRGPAATPSPGPLEVRGEEKMPKQLMSPILRSADPSQELSLKRMLASANVSVTNTFGSVSELHEYLDKLDLLNSERLRPSWDTYFMLLSELASHRANCMKRKVGCILVKDTQIIATGYNGTPKGITNCNEGGCPRCNAGTPCGVSLDHCLCIHAEENALLEAGRGRVRNAQGVVLYCNTCPCLGCAKKIVQVGVGTVVYSKGYGMDALTLKLFKEAGIEVRQHTPPTLSMEIGSP
ncbi:Deoxycytidine monophosphate (dCMP) deaminase [Linderina pennispora]|nr:Deoxycytidine monophosphate (dCMP) deaminase [Linderina pennispora]